MVSPLLNKCLLWWLSFEKVLFKFPIWILLYSVIVSNSLKRLFYNKVLSSYMKQNDKLNEVSKPIIFNSHVNKRNWDIFVFFFGSYIVFVNIFLKIIPSEKN